MAVKKLGFNILKSKIWNLIKLYGIIEWAISLVSFINKFSAFQDHLSRLRPRNTVPTRTNNFKQLRHPVRQKKSFLRRSTHLVDTCSIYLSPTCRQRPPFINVSNYLPITITPPVSNFSSNPFNILRRKISSNA